MSLWSGILVRAGRGLGVCIPLAEANLALQKPKASQIRAAGVLLVWCLLAFS